MKLNAPLPRPTVASLYQTLLDPTGGRVAFVCDLRSDEVFELFSAPTDGSGLATRLSAGLVDGGDVAEVQLASAGGLAVFRADARTVDVRELYSVPLDGSHLPIRLNRTPAPGTHGVDSFRISADGRRVAFVSDQETSHVRELFGTCIEHFASDVKLSGPLTEGGDVTEFALTADGSRAVYLADQETDEQFELYAVAPDLTRLKLNGSLIPQGDVRGASNDEPFRISPDGARVVYRADDALDERFGLFSVPIDASLPAVRLSPDLAPGQAVSRFRIDAGSGRALFLESGDDDLWSAPLDGGAPAVRLNVVGDDVLDFELGPDGLWAVYRVFRGAAAIELHAVPADGSLPPRRLDPVPYHGEVRDFVVRPDGAGVVFRSWRAPVMALASVPIDGSAAPTPLSLLAAGNQYVVQPDSLHVLFRGQLAPGGADELLRVPFDGSAAPFALSGPLVTGGGVQSFQVSADGSEVLYLATQDLPTVSEAYSVPSDGSRPAVKATPPMPPGPTVGDVAANPRVLSDGSRVLYRADQEEDGRFELFSVPIDARTAPVRLSDGSPVLGFEATPNAALAVLLEQTDSFSGELFSIPPDGGAAPTFLTSLFGSGSGETLLSVTIEVSPDSQRALCQTFGRLGLEPVRGRLVSVSLDGSTPGVVLAGPSVRDFAIDAGSSCAVFRDPSELWSRLLDGSLPAVRLNGTLVPGGAVASFELTPDGMRALYLADQETDGLVELYSVPIDGSTAPDKLSGAAAGIGTSGLALTPDSTWVAFAQETPSGARLRARRTDGSGALVELAPLAGTGSQAKPRIGAGGRVVYEDEPPTPLERLLLSVPLDGSAAPTLLSDRAGNFLLSPDGEWVVHTSSVGVFSVPVDGSAAAVRLSRTAEAGQDLAVCADSSTVAFRVGRNLFRAPIDGSAPATRVNPPLVERGAVDDFQLTADGSTLVYRADQEEDEVYELFAGHHFGYKRPTSGPGDAGTRGGP